jgi:glutathione synthase
VRVGFLINDFDSLVPSQTTAMMMDAACTLGHEPLVFGVAELGVDVSGHIVASARTWSGPSSSLSENVAAVHAATPARVAVDSLDAVLIRTNPARDPRQWAHDAALQLMARARDLGVTVRNDPDGLRDAGSKVLLATLPASIRPATLLSCDRAELVAFVRDAPGPTVLKPARGTRGADVFRLEPDSSNLAVVVDVLLRQGFVVAQEFVPEAVGGDTRVVVLDGAPLERDGHVCAIRRLPAGGDFRSNLHAGGTAAPAEVTPGMLEAIATLAPTLRSWGLRLVGLDFLGDKLCEINAFSTGGFRDAERFSGQPFTRLAVEALLERDA